jgi:hypothetical protein
MPAKERQMPEKKYTQDDFEAMSVRAGAIKDFAETLTYVDNRANSQPPFTSVALIITELIDPVIDFPAWAYTYAEIPEEEPETATQ